jgi:hypothetical protein
MSTKIPVHDSLFRLAQVGSSMGVQLVQISGLSGGNRYQADPVEFGPDHATRLAGADPITVTNLAEPADSDGVLPAGTEAVAIDVEGFWIIYVRPSATASSLSFAARVAGSLGGAMYRLVEQVSEGATGMADKPGGMSVAGRNLAELSLGPGAAVDAGTIVLVTAIADQQGGSAQQYVFDHPEYAKYLD